MSHQDDLTDYINHLIQGMVDSGVTQAVISPGSRSTPVSLLLNAHPDVETFVAVDERSAGFFALGISKQTGRSTILVCTSGTAASNYFPAISEAKASNVSLLVMTTDRPHELRNSGAPQTMDQLHLYGTHVKKFVDLSVPGSNNGLLDYAYVEAYKAVQESERHPKGPVHLNLPLREPLMPNMSTSLLEREPIVIIEGYKQVSDDTVEKYVQSWSSKKGLFLVGPDFPEKAIASLIECSTKLGWPILADPLSNIRNVQNTETAIISTYDTILKNTEVCFEVESIVRFGKPMISKVLNEWIVKQNASYTIIDPSGQRLDPSKKATVWIDSDENIFLNQVIQSTQSCTNFEWWDKWFSNQRTVQSVIDSYMTEDQVLTEGKVAHLIHQTIPADSQLFVSNSMPIRDFDTYMTGHHHGYHIYGNRGVNGIDGIISTASGVSVMKKENQTFVLVGDLACFHDMNALLLAQRYELPLTIIVINNNGGGIFSMLPQKSLPSDTFEVLFGTPLNLDLKRLSQSFGLEYSSVETTEDLSTQLKRISTIPRLIEIQTDREQSLLDRKKFNKMVTEALKYEN